MTAAPVEQVRRLRRAPLAPVSDSEGSRPRILITHEEQEVSAQAVAALARVSGIYQRAGGLVDVIRDPEKLGGAPRVRELPLARLREVLAGAADWMQQRKRRGEDGERPVLPAHPPDWCVRAVHARGEWPGVPTLVGVVECPVLRADGTVLQDTGYDVATGLLYVPSGSFPSVSEAPTRDDAVAACLELLTPFVDFPFAGEEHRSAALSAVLSPLARPAYEGPSPLKGIDATTPGTGKTLLLDTIVTIHTGRPAAKMPHTTEDEETRKAITSLAIEGCTVAAFDNVAHPLGSPALDNALTSTTWKDRALGRNVMVTVPLRVEWMATGNNLTYVGDTFRRVLPIRLESPLENPEARAGFAHEDLRAFVLRDRPLLVRAALTILRAYFVAGCPDQGLPRWGSYEGWSRLIPHALVWAGMADPMKTRIGLENIADSAKSALESLLDGWAKLDDGKGLAVSAVLRMLYPTSRDRPPEPDFYSDLRDAIEATVSTQGGKTPDAVRLGKQLQKVRGRVCGGRMFDALAYQGTKRWRVVDSFGGGRGGRGDDYNPSCEDSDHTHIEGSTPPPPQQPPRAATSDEWWTQ